MNKSGKVCLALLCAFFVGRLTSAVLAVAPDGAGMTLEQYEQLFGLDLTIPENAILDYDGDGLSNLAEWYNKGTDPCKADTDDDGWPDGIDNEISRARLDFHPLFTDGDCLRYVWPAFMVSAFKAGEGEWENSLPAWYVPAGTGGKLCLNVDRSVLTNDVVLELEFYDAPNASLFVDLVNDNQEALISSEIVGNLMDGSGEIVRKAMHISLASYPEAVGIHIRGTGELFLFEGLLFVDRENDGLDADQEAILGTSDLMLDSDGDGISDYDEVFVYGTNPAVPDRSGANGFPAQDPDVQEPVVSPTSPPSNPAFSGMNPAGSGTSPQAFQATRIKAITISQWLLAGMSGANFIISRDTLDNGGTRRTSPAFIMEDSFAQSSAIGFSYGSLITLHAGYQQADNQQLEIWNVGVISSVFNPMLGELTTLSYVLSTRSPNVNIEVTDNITTGVLVDSESQGPGLHAVVWDGKDANGNYVTPGWWTFMIRAADYQGRVITNIEAQVRIWQVIPVIHSVSDVPDPFCPTTNGTTTISYTTANQPQNRNLDVFIDIEDAYGNSVANFSSLNQTPGSYSYNWDGTGAARNGLYIYRINATNAAPPIRSANEKSGSIILACGTECVTNQDGNITVCYQPDGFSIAITGVVPDQVSEASRAILTAEPNLLFQSRIYDIKADPPTSFDPPAILTFKYDSAIVGDIDAKLQIRRYDPAATNWVIVSPQFIDYVNNRIIAEVTNLSLYAVFAAEEPAVPVVLEAMVRLEPEALNVNPGILTAFVRLPAGYPVRNITSAACDGALYERMMLNDDETEMIIKFRRQDIEAALAQIGESIDIYFVVRGTWQDDAGNSYIFQGTDSITKIVGGK